jgi:MoaA/NifB/PqqE/SkfB family radical SAM enzyme
MLSSIVEAQLAKSLRHLYINPLEKCNLRCKICYTRKTDPILSNVQILKFLDDYQVQQPVETVTFCGGEVFALVSFPELLNEVNARGIFAQVITNGTIDRLEQIKNPNFVNLIVSLDGVEKDHDANRGAGNFRKSIEFMKKAHRLDFHLDVFSIIHKQNLSHLDHFEAALQQELGFLPVITYHPRKPPMYLNTHPISNIFGEVDQFDFLSKKEMLQVMQTRNVFPPKDLGCYQIAVTSTGKVYGCCEGTVPLGMMTDPPAELIQKLRARLERWSKNNTSLTCLGCSQHEFMCGIKEYLSLLEKPNYEQKTSLSPNFNQSTGSAAVL